MSKYVVMLLLAVIVIVMGKTVLMSWPLVLLLALALAIAAASGTVGKWGYAAAAIVAVLAVPGMLFGGFRMILRMAPLLLLVFGIYWLIRPKGR